MRPRLPRPARALLGWAALALLLPAAAIPDRAAELRWRGLAELENERPAEAEATFRALAELAPRDPLPDADLAVALLRQQKGEAALAAVDRALRLTPGRADLLAIRGEVLSWSARPEEALAAFDQAVKAAPDDPEILYAAYRQATARGADAEAKALAARALARLAELRPENLIVLLQAGSRAIAAGDRAGATAAYLRLREILWAPPPAAAAGLGQVLAALERGEVAAARVPALRLENVLKVTPMYQGSLRELSRSILGVPVLRFHEEPPAAEWGPPLAVTFRGERLEAAAGGAGLALADFDGDGRMDIARLRTGEPAPALEVRLAAGGKTVPVGAAPGIGQLVAVDLDNDGATDIIGYGAGGIALWKGDGKGGFTPSPAVAPNTVPKTGPTGAITALVPFDFDVDGDLDLAVALQGRGIELYRNPGTGPLEPVDGKPFPPLPGLAGRTVSELVATDLDRDGDLDLLAVHDGGLLWLENLRQGRFADRTAASGLGAVGPARAAVAVDLDDDGLPDLAVLAAKGDALSFWHNLGGRFAPWTTLEAPLGAGARYASLIALDADNDGRLDLALAGPSGVAVLARRRARFEPLPLTGAPASANDGGAAGWAVAAADLDGDGGVDLVVAGPAGLHRLANIGGKAGHWLAVRLRGLTQGNGKNNLGGLGAVVEVRAGNAYQLREVTSPVTHFGLGRLPRADVLRVVWGNGVPQDRLAVAGDRTVVEQQVLKGSCPFLYAWDGERMRFVTDLLWNAPLGLPVAPGVYVPPDPGELVRVDGAVPRDGRYELAVTEELWEAAFFDRLRLWVVDAPAEVEVASNLRVVPGAAPAAHRVGVLGSRGLRPVAAAWDGEGRDATERVRRRDEVYADGYRRGPYQGVAAAPWTFTFDLGEAPGRPIRLHLDGWIFPADASLNLAAAQRRDLPYAAPRLEVETAAGWRVLMPAMGHPAGKTKTMVVDTPPLPPGARRLRIVTSLWLGWDRIAWTDRPDDGAPLVRARLEPERADLAYRGFSRLVRRAPNAPHAYDYGRVSTRSPWLPLPGHYTRYGDVRELLLEADDRSVILAAGDELALAFDAAIPAPPAGFRRTVFLESLGWDKDADRNTWRVEQVEPLPFRAMSGYPGRPGEGFPNTPFLREYRNVWLTREVAPAAPGPRPATPGVLKEGETDR